MFSKMVINCAIIPTMPNARCVVPVPEGVTDGTEDHRSSFKISSCSQGFVL